MLLIDAPKLDLRHFKCCFAALQRLGVGREGDGMSFGHVWLLLVDRQSGRQWECGYSAEMSPTLPSYFAGVGQLLKGRCSKEMARSGADLQNPIGFLFTNRSDGYLQWGSGGHMPSCAIAWRLERLQFDRVLQAVQSFPKGPYSLQNANCVHFALELTRSLGWAPDCSVTLPIPRMATLAGRKVTLWRDARYSSLHLCTPGALENQIRNQFPLEEIDCALRWYALQVAG